MAEESQIKTSMSRREWTLVILLVISVVINYVDRSNLSLAAPLIQRQFALSPLQLGSLLSAFFWTYALMQLFGVAGWISDRFAVGWVLVGGYVLWSGATIATGLVGGFSTLYAARLLLGAGESVAYPCYSRVFAELPQEHRGRANALIDVGTKLGPSAGMFVGGLLLVHLGWRMLFIVLGDQNDAARGARRQNGERGSNAVNFEDVGNEVRVGSVLRALLRKLLLLFPACVAPQLPGGRGEDVDGVDVETDRRCFPADCSVDSGGGLGVRSLDCDGSFADAGTAGGGGGRTGCCFELAAA
jgi:hypothetical protein